MSVRPVSYEHTVVCIELSYSLELRPTRRLVSINQYCLNFLEVESSNNSSRLTQNAAETVGRGDIVVSFTWIGSLVNLIRKLINLVFVQYNFCAPLLYEFLQFTGSSLMLSAAFFAGQLMGYWTFTKCLNKIEKRLSTAWNQFSFIRRRCDIEHKHLLWWQKAHIEVWPTAQLVAIRNVRSDACSRMLTAKALSD